MGGTWALAILLWVTTLGYSVVDSGLWLTDHCRLTTLGALLGHAPECAPESPKAPQAEVTSAGSGGPSSNPWVDKLRAGMASRFPGLHWAGAFNCRHQRGSGSDPSCWSEHAWDNAEDWFPSSGPGHPRDPELLRALAWTHRPDVVAAYNINDSWIDTSPGDLHVQFNPAHSCGQVPPCAGGVATLAPATPAGAVLLRAMLGTQRGAPRLLAGTRPGAPPEAEATEGLGARRRPRLALLPGGRPYRTVGGPA